MLKIAKMGTLTINAVFSGFTSLHHASVTWYRENLKGDCALLPQLSSYPPLCCYLPKMFSGNNSRHSFTAMPYGCQILPISTNGSRSATSVT